MTAVKTVAFPIRASKSLNRSRVQQPARGSSFTEQGRAETWPGEIEQVAGAVEQPAPRPRIVLRPMLGPHGGLDVTEAVIRVVAQELWNLHGGNDVMNWLEAERLLREFIGSRPVARRSDGQGRA